MPTYEYGCTSCGQHIEVFQRISEDPLTTCGVCGGKLRKVFHPAGIVFKGSGFYATDSRSKPSEKKADATSGTSAGAGTDSGKGDSSSESGGSGSSGADGASSGSVSKGSKETSS